MFTILLDHVNSNFAVLDHTVYLSLFLFRLILFLPRRYDSTFFHNELNLYLNLFIFSSNKLALKDVLSIRKTENSLRRGGDFPLLRRSLRRWLLLEGLLLFHFLLFLRNRLLLLLLLLSLASVLSASFVSSFLDVLKGFTILSNMLEEIRF